MGRAAAAESSRWEWPVTFCPPITTELKPLAVLEPPPSTQVPLPCVMLLVPPRMQIQSPPAVLILPPEDAGRKAGGGVI